MTTPQTGIVSDGVMEERAAVASFGSLAADFVLRPQIWDLFETWLMDEGEAKGEWDPNVCAHLAWHLRNIATSACDDAGIPRAT